MAPWIVGNATLHFQWTPALGFTFTVDNLTNATPPPDHSYPGSSNVPYNVFNYNVYGRSYLIQVTYGLSH